MATSREKKTEKVMETLSNEKINYVRLFFTDILGELKGMTVSTRELTTIMARGQGFDGSSVEGFCRIEESDLMAWPDPDTFRILPWDLNGERVALMLCDIKNPDDSPFTGDPRYILKRMVRKLKKAGHIPKLGPELEYFYFQSSDSTTVVDNAKYFSHSTTDRGTLARKKAVIALEQMGIHVECSHHEVAPSQHEIDLEYDDALRMADTAMLYRMTVKELASVDGLYATFMPKPMAGVNGSGMHVHQSFFDRGGRNAFFSKRHRYNLSPLAQYYLAGILMHSQAMCMVTNQWVNSYKRLVPGYEAPVYLSWGRKNRSSLIRIPQYRVGQEKATRIELRFPDPACNPYLAFTAMLASGLDGIQRELPLRAPIEKDIFGLTDRERSRLKIDTLPRTLREAIVHFQGSTIMRQALGNHTFHTLIDNKLIECENYDRAVTDHEIKTHLAVL